MSRSRATMLAAVAIVAVAAGWWLLAAGEDSPPTQPQLTVTTGTAGEVDPESGLRWIAAAALPSQARATLALIAAGGPFPYGRDGSAFQNREGLLPDGARGYYREYTVVTPGSDDRGARRIVAGAGGERYYTDDHYASFRRIGP
ncbi:MAG TPA: ribonuclease domain-containing protein [Gaiellaceae bacterium]|nr:ribonuclease domain-containing protein [Gaiellaceae bacterium]